MFYFAYGSNMSSKRLNSRIPAVFECVATLPQHELRYHKLSKKDNSGKCDIFHTDNPCHLVHGVVFSIQRRHKTILDVFEGLGFGYDHKVVTLARVDNGQPLDAVTYYATQIDPTIKPLDWYVEHVLVGAREFGLCQDYVRDYLAVESVQDSNQRRRAKELSIYNSCDQ